MKIFIEGGVELELEIAERETDFGIHYWQAKYSFPVAGGAGRLHGTTLALHATPEDAERTALDLARDQGWGTPPAGD